MTPRSHFLLAIAAARAEGFDHYSSALLALYRQQYPATELPAFKSPYELTQRRRQARKDSFAPAG